MARDMLQTSCVTVRSCPTAPECFYSLWREICFRTRASPCAVALLRPKVSIRYGARRASEPEHRIDDQRGSRFYSLWRETCFRTRASPCAVALLRPKVSIRYGARRASEPEHRIEDQRGSRFYSLSRETCFRTSGSEGTSSASSTVSIRYGARRASELEEVARAVDVLASFLFAMARDVLQNKPDPTPPAVMTFAFLFAMARDVLQNRGTLVLAMAGVVGFLFAMARDVLQNRSRSHSRWASCCFYSLWRETCFRTLTEHAAGLHEGRVSIRYGARRASEPATGPDNSDVVPFVSIRYGARRASERAGSTCWTRRCPRFLFAMARDVLQNGNNADEKARKLLFLFAMARDVLQNHDPSRGQRRHQRVSIRYGARRASEPLRLDVCGPGCRVSIRYGARRASERESSRGIIMSSWPVSIRYGETCFRTRYRAGR